MSSVRLSAWVAYSKKFRWLYTIDVFDVDTTNSCLYFKNLGWRCGSQAGRLVLRRSVICEVFRRGWLAIRRSRGLAVVVAVYVLEVFSWTLKSRWEMRLSAWAAGS